MVTDWKDPFLSQMERQQDQPMVSRIEVKPLSFWIVKGLDGSWRKKIMMKKTWNHCCKTSIRLSIALHGQIQRGGETGGPDPPGKSQDLVAKGFLINTRDKNSTHPLVIMSEI